MNYFGKPRAAVDAHGTVNREAMGSLVGISASKDATGQQECSHDATEGIAECARF